MSGIQLENVSKLYQQGENQVLALDNISLTVDKVSLLLLLAHQVRVKVPFLQLQAPYSNHLKVKLFLTAGALIS